jgi:hypothetical protein
MVASVGEVADGTGADDTAGVTDVSGSAAVQAARIMKRKQ